MKNISKFSRAALAFLFAFIFSAAGVQAQLTLTLQPGPQDGYDTPIGIYTSQSNYDNMNFSFMTELVSKALTVGGTCSIARSLLKFDLSSIPSNATVLSAKLSLYFDSTATNPPHSGANASYLRKITSAWTNTTVTWNTQPSVTAAGQVTLAQSTSPTEDYTNMDVTAMVSDMVANPSTNFGFELGLFTEACDRELTFCGSKYSHAYRRPKLAVEYNVIVEGITAQIAPELFRVYPNPCRETLQVACGISDVKLELFTITGSQVASTKLDGGNSQVDVSHLPAGLYIYKATGASQKSISGKLVIE